MSSVSFASALESTMIQLQLNNLKDKLFNSSVQTLQM